MGTQESDELDDVLNVIARQARASNTARAELVAAIMEQLPSRIERVEEAVRAAHQLAGSAGTFGMAEASRLARRLENFLSAGSFDDADLLAGARTDLAALQQHLATDS